MCGSKVGTLLAVVTLLWSSWSAGQVLTPLVTLNIYPLAECANLGSGVCKQQCNSTELSVYPYSCYFYSLIYGVQYQRCVTSMPCCYLPGQSCQTSCSRGQTQLNSQWTCNTAGQVCCSGVATAVTTATASTATTASTSARTATTTTTMTTTTASVARRQGLCGRLPTSRIIGGSVAGVTDWPWMVRLIYSTTSGFCAGVLVDADTVVTAAHCVAGINAAAMQVIVGDYDTSRYDTGEEVVNVASYSMVSGFIRGTRGRDYAVVKLKWNVAFTNRKLPACLYDPAIPLRSPLTCYMAGWGVNEKGIGGPMRAVNVQVLDRITCQNRIGRTLPSDILCTNNPASSPTDGCLFDDGDMLVCRDIQDRWSLIGVMSEFSCGGGLPVLFTDVRPYVDVTLQQL